MSLNRLTMNNIFCSNLVYFTYFVNILEKTKSVYEVDLLFKSQIPVRIDIVADNGHTWIKVIARNSKALSDTARGMSNYGSKSILDHARSFAIAASQNLHCFKRPKVIYQFINNNSYILSKFIVTMKVDSVPQTYLKKSIKPELNSDFFGFFSFM